jgi:hypothetical protein
MEVGLAGSHRDVQHVCGFLVRVTVDTDEDEDGAIALRQLGDGPLEVDARACA